VLVIDHLQLLDQRRTSAELAAQMAALRAFARATGCIVACISQIQSSFDQRNARLPDWRDVRLPNALDLHVFDKALFLHQGRSRLCAPA
jgi:replicative DNA helicase